MDQLPTWLTCPCHCATEVYALAMVQLKSMFTRLIIRLFQLVFSAKTVFLSHNKSVNAIFQPAYQPSRTGPKVPVPRPILSEPRVMEIYWQQGMLSAWVCKLFSFFGKMQSCNLCSIERAKYCE
jgi:hypothetical protein